MPIPDKLLRETFKKDQKFLKTSKVPLLTVSGTYQEDLKGLHHLEESDLKHDVVYSRAHYSMAIGIVAEAWKKDKKIIIDPKEAWLVDPTNYVDVKETKTVMITEVIGKLLARQPLLKKLKDFVDKFGRSSLPILASITPPLKRLTKDHNGPFLSFHIAAGNILLAQGKTVVQMITDPHVREDYLTHAEKNHAYYLVFDEHTKQEAIEKAEKLGKQLDPKRVIVTGPPIDPRVVAAGKNKKPWSGDRPLRIALTTGGLGTNKVEIDALLEQLLPELTKKNPKYEVLVYAGTHDDIKDLVVEGARKHDIPYREVAPYDPAQFEIGKELTAITPDQETAVPLTVIYHPQIIDANELLIKYGFPWADGFISKPSGDMAYDAVAAGCFLLTLAEWGEWEHNIREKFTKHEVAQVAEIKNIVTQLETLRKKSGGKDPWVKTAMKKAQSIEQQDPLLLKGAKNILTAFKKVKH